MNRTIVFRIEDVSIVNKHTGILQEKQKCIFRKRLEYTELDVRITNKTDVCFTKHWTAYRCDMSQ